MGVFTHLTLLKKWYNYKWTRKGPLFKWGDIMNMEENKKTFKGVKL